MNCTVYNRIRRDQAYEFITTTDSIGSTNATVMPINNTTVNFTQTMPLDVLIIVRGSGAQSDQLILGKDTKLILASPSKKYQLLNMSNIYEFYYFRLVNK